MPLLPRVRSLTWFPALTVETLFPCRANLAGILTCFVACVVERSRVQGVLELAECALASRGLEKVEEGWSRLS